MKLEFVREVVVRIGPGESVIVEFYDDELVSVLASYLTTAVMQSGEEAGPYLIEVHGAPPPGPRKDNELEASGDGFCFRMDPRRCNARAYLWGELPGWQVACPLRQLFSWIVAHSGGVLLHASAIHMPEFGGAIVFAGPSGSGKSTLVHHMANGAEDTVLGDDWVIVREIEADGRRLWTVQSLYTSLKVAPEWPTFRRPDFAYNGKNIYRCRTTNHVVPVKVLVLPRVTGTEKLIWCMASSVFDAVKQAAPSTLLQSAGVPPSTLGVIRRFAAAVPRYDLTASREWLPCMRDMMGALLRQGV